MTAPRGRAWQAISVSVAPDGAQAKSGTDLAIEQRRPVFRLRSTQATAQLRTLPRKTFSRPSFRYPKWRHAIRRVALGARIRSPAFLLPTCIRRPPDTRGIADSWQSAMATGLLCAAWRSVWLPDPGIGVPLQIPCIRLYLTVAAARSPLRETAPSASCVSAPAAATRFATRAPLSNTAHPRTATASNSRSESRRGSSATRESTPFGPARPAATVWTRVPSARSPGPVWTKLNGRWP
jgi:hypothetical protein